MNFLVIILNQKLIVQRCIGIYMNPLIYRGTVINNIDPKNIGRIKVFVPGIYPSEYSLNSAALPWSEPAMSLFGGCSSSVTSNSQNFNTGIASVPHKNANVFLFFENGDHNKPVYFAATQSKDNWISEHPNQHVIKTDNVEIIVDDVPSDGTKDATVTITVTGDVNLNITGDVQQTITGDWTIDQTGDLTINQNGTTTWNSNRIDFNKN